MKMDEMNAYFESKGFEVKRTYRDGRYEFIISKNGVHHRGVYEWPHDQRIFIDQMITDFEAEFSKYLGEKNIHSLSDLEQYAYDHYCHISISQSFSGEVTIEVEHGDDNFTRTFHVNKPGPSWLCLAKQMIDDITYTNEKEMWPKMNPYINNGLPKIKNVIFNDPATIVFWSDGSKTVVKCQDDDWYDPEKGLAMAISKKALGNKGNYCNEIKKWLPEEEPDINWFDIKLPDFNKSVSDLQRKIYDTFGATGMKTKREAVEKAYNILFKIAKDSSNNHRDYRVPMDDIDAAISYLGEALED